MKTANIIDFRAYRERRSSRVSAPPSQWYGAPQNVAFIPQYVVFIPVPVPVPIFVGWVIPIWVTMGHCAAGLRNE
jgi:hypothetical protein